MALDEITIIKIKCQFTNLYESYADKCLGEKTELYSKLL